MQQLVTFFIKHKNFIVFLLLLGVSLLFFIQSHHLQKTRFFNSASWVTGNIYVAFNTIDSYFSLKKDNRLLLEENKNLRTALFNRENTIDSFGMPLKNYEVITAKIIKNSFSRPKNYLTVNKGRVHGVSEDMGVVTSNGIVGIVENTSGYFGHVQSILNEHSRINVKIKRTNHFGTLEWNAKEYTTVQLIDIPRLATIKKGDTIVTGGMSAIFPEGIPVGSIKDFKLDDSQSYFIINVLLFNDMTSLEHVYMIKNIQREERLELQQSVEDE